MPTSRADPRAGFTLVELLAVLVVMAFAATAVLQLGRASTETAKVRGFLIQAEALMREARTLARTRQSAIDVVIDPDQRLLRLPARDTVLAVPTGVTLEGKLARMEGDQQGFVVRFFPDGGSTGAELPFSYRGQLYELRVNWLTGHAGVRRG